MTESPPSLRLESDFVPGAEALTLRLINGDSQPLAGFRLGITGMFHIGPEAGIANGRLIEQLAYHQVVAPPEDFILAPHATWTATVAPIVTDASTRVPRHYTYGPQSAYVVLADGAVRRVAVAPMTRGGIPGAPSRTAAPATALPTGEPPLAVIPHPTRVQVAGARDATPGLALMEGPGEARLAYQAARDLAARLFDGARPLFAESGTLCVAQVAPMPAEAYRIDFAAEAISVFAAGHAGFFYAFVTLGQALHGARQNPSRFTLPLSGTIEDAPRFAYRGALLDVSRHVFRIDAVHRFIDVIAWHKINRAHLHLTDDEGWRIEIPAHSELTEIGGWRGHGLALPPMFGSPGERQGAVYAKADVAALVAQATTLAVTVVPEIDVPGHSHATLSALPALRDPGETGVYYGVHFYPNNALNPAMEATYAFLETVFGTIADLFPSPLIHIGGDEVADGAWLGSPQARALMRQHGWTETAQLQSHFLKRVQAMVRSLGRRTGAWEEAAHGGGIEAAQSLLYAWTKPESGLALARAGYDVVLTPGTRYYLDMAQSDDWWEPGATWAGTAPLDLTYGYEPGADWPADLQPHLKGVQAALWGEPLGEEPGLIDHLLFPRLSAVAETAWSPAARKNLTRFLAIQDLMPRTGL